jgi:hypothetical protein
MYLTPQGVKYSKGAVSGLSEAGAPEIEVTPEMIEAGTMCFLEGDQRIDLLENIIARVFRA